MIPFAVLALAFLFLRTLGFAGLEHFDHWQAALRPAVALMFLLTASAHWGRGRADLIRMVPPAFPRPGLIITVTGLLEIAGAIGILLPWTAPAAAFGLTALLIAMFPANVHAARIGAIIRGRPATPLPLRTLLQVVFIAAVIAAGW